MHRSRRINVLNSNKHFIFVNYFGWYVFCCNFAKQAIRHANLVTPSGKISSCMNRYIRGLYTFYQIIGLIPNFFCRQVGAVLDLPHNTLPTPAAASASCGTATAKTSAATEAATTTKVATSATVVSASATAARTAGRASTRTNHPEYNI